MSPAFAWIICIITFVMWLFWSWVLGFLVDFAWPTRLILVGLVINFLIMFQFFVSITEDIGKTFAGITELIDEKLPDA